MNCLLGPNNVAAYLMMSRESPVKPIFRTLNNDVLRLSNASAKTFSVAPSLNLYHTNRRTK